MDSMTLVGLTANDLPALFEFEQENRHWFERFIHARPDGFYSAHGIGDHIHDCLRLVARNDMVAGLIKDSHGCILGRANLREFNHETRHATLGYRIAADETGRGVATFAVGELLDWARRDLASIGAYVLENNPASARVLEKHGFAKNNKRHGRVVIGDRIVDRYAYQLELT